MATSGLFSKACHPDIIQLAPAGYAQEVTKQLQTTPLSQIKVDVTLQVVKSPEIYFSSDLSLAYLQKCLKAIICRYN